MPEYRLAEAERSTTLNREASERSAAAGAANQRADDYMLAVVLFAAALFFAAISGKVHGRRQPEFLLGLGAVMLVGTAAWVLNLPMSFGR